ncbi:MAG: polymer-forming cytoskeletal protein [bacterium]|nr:polymer-forming cytoskeletal protein [bacterium]
MNKPSHKFIGISLYLLFFSVSPAHGATFLPISNEAASLRSEASGDVYAASKFVVIAAPVQGDIFAAGDGVDISGSSSASIFAVGRNLNITGDANDDVRIAGSIISVDSNIAHDLFALGSQIFISKDTQVHGDAYIAGENVTISGTVHGNVRATGSKITFTNDAVVMGDITVYGNAPTIEDNAKISGKVTTIAPQTDTKKVSRGIALRTLLTTIVSTAVLALALLYSAPILVAKSKDLVSQRPIQSAIIGLLWLLLCIPATILFLTTSIGIFIGLFVLTSTIPLLIIAFGFVIIATGSIIYRLMLKKDGVAWQHVLIGAAVVGLVAQLNVIGFLLITTAFLIALGAILNAFWSLIQGK